MRMAFEFKDEFDRSRKSLLSATITINRSNFLESTSNAAPRHSRRLTSAARVERSRLVFLSGDNEDAIAPVAALAKQLGFAPVKLGKLNEGGALVHARGRSWGHLIFQDFFKKAQ